uniref:Uncharacterized protein n=1 Tax=Aegilops tauschii TaxID=37682 RepID=M8AHN2_AEGTA
MVNLVEAQKPLLHFLIKWAGLRQHTVDVDGAGTVLTFWVPKDKVPGNSSTVTPEEKQSETKANSRRPSVVLVHGFAAEGIVTWQFQVGALAKHYDVYIPDLLYFGGSTSPSTDRSPGFQAECLVAALGKLGVERCTVVGFSYGGMVAFKMAEAHPGLVRSLVVSGAATLVAGGAAFVGEACVSGASGQPWPGGWLTELGCDGGV